MSRSNNWVRIDKNIAQAFKEINRPFSRVEALVSHSININCGCGWTIAGYAKRWQWSRDKVRKFVQELHSDAGHIVKHGKTPFRQPVHMIDAGFQGEADTNPTAETPTGSRQEADRKPTAEKQEADTNPTANRHHKPNKTGDQKGQPDSRPTAEKQQENSKPTGSKQEADRKPDSIIKTKTKTNKKSSAKTPATGVAENTPGIFYRTKKGKKLAGGKLADFLRFWELFNDKRGKAAAADTWLSLPDYSTALVGQIHAAAEIYAAHRPGLKASGNTPKMAEGWLSARRYEDDLQPPGQSKPQEQKPQYDYSSLTKGALVEIDGHRYRIDRDTFTIQRHDGVLPEVAIKKLYRQGRLAVVGG